MCKQAEGKLTMQACLPIVPIKNMKENNCPYM